MNRRKLISIAGASTLGVATLGFVYAMDQGYIEDLGDAPVNEEIDGGTASFTFDVGENDVIRMDLNVRSRGSEDGYLRLYDPTDEEVLSRSTTFRSDREIQHTPQQVGEYRLEIDVADARVRLRVSTAEWEP